MDKQVIQKTTKGSTVHDPSKSPQALIDFDHEDQDKAMNIPSPIYTDEDDQLTEDGFVKVNADVLRKQNVQNPAEDMVVAVMGVTGSGKSTFISLLADEEVEVGHGLESSTVNIGLHSYSYTAGKTVFLIDFPGFSDTVRTDADLLKDISCFLATIRRKHCRLIGVLYLHRITDVRMGGSALKNLRLFEQLCGLETATGITFVTTMWNELERTGSNVELGFKRQEQLQQPQFWGTMIAAGSQVNRHDGSREGAQQIVSRFINQNSDIVLNIVRQLVDESKTLDKTDAGQFINQELQQAQKKFEKELIEYQESMEEAVRARDEESVETIAREKEHAQNVIKEQQLALQSLHLDLEGLTQEQNPKFQSLAMNLSMRDASQSEDHTVVPKTRDVATEKRIRNLEEGLSALRQKEMQYQKTLALQQVNQEAQNLAQIQHMRQMADRNQEEMAYMTRQLDYERQQRKKEKRHANKAGAFFWRLFNGGITEHLQLKPDRSSRLSRRRDDIDMDLAYY